MSSEKIFTRQQVAEILNVPAAMAGERDDGKAASTVPFGRFLGKKGARRFSQIDLYRLGIVAELVGQGLQPLLIETLLPLFKDAWLQPKQRGLVVYGRSTKNIPRAVHFNADVETGAITAVLVREGVLAWGWLNTKRLLDQIDKKAKKTAGVAEPRKRKTK